jgi:hypothetical protein
MVVIKSKKVRRKMKKITKASKKLFWPLMIIGILLGSTVSAGAYMMLAPKGHNNNFVNPIIPSDNGTLDSDVSAAWMQYGQSATTTQIVSVDPGIAQVRPGEELNELAAREGQYNFTDHSSLTSGYYPPGYYNEDGMSLRTETGTPQASTTANSKSASSGSGQQVVQRTIEEADLVKVVGSKLYVLNMYRGLYIIDISDPANATILGRCPVVGEPVEMYVVGSVAIVTVRSDYSFWMRYWEMDALGQGTGSIGTMIYIVSVAHPAEPIIYKIVELKGFAGESRRVGHVIYQTTNIYEYYSVPMFNMKVAASDSIAEKDSTIVTSIDFGNPYTLGMKDRVVFEGSSVQVHASVSAFYVAQNIYSETVTTFSWTSVTEEVRSVDTYVKVKYLDITDPNGDIKVCDSFTTKGEVYDKYQMDEYAGMFRIVTHTWDGQASSFLTIFDVSDPKDITTISHTRIDDTGTLTATRFAGNRAYTIHLPQTRDPLDVLDLSDPADPKLCAKFEMDGWVTHMEVYGNYILALGVDNSDGNTNVAVSLFDVSNPYDPVMLSRVRLGGNYAYSSANWEPKALTVDMTHHLVVVPFDTYYYSSKDGQTAGVQLVSFDLEAGTLTLQGTVTGRYSIERTRVIGDHILATSFASMEVIGIKDLANPVIEKNLTLAIDIVNTIPVGIYSVQMVQPYDHNGFQIRSVRSIDDLEAITAIDVPASWGILIETPRGIILAADIIDDGNITGTLFKVTVASDGTMSITRIGGLETGSSFVQDYYNRLCYDSNYYYPYYYGAYQSAQMVLSGDSLAFLKLGDHEGIRWYSTTDEYGGYSPHIYEEERADDVLYVFDLSNLASVPSPLTMTINEYRPVEMFSDSNSIYIQHQMSGYDNQYSEEYGYSYNSFYKNYVTRVMLLGHSGLVLDQEYNIPGQMVGVSNGILYTVSELEGGSSMQVLNVLTLSEGVAKIVSSVALMDDWATVIMDGTTAYAMATHYSESGMYDCNGGPSGSDDETTSELWIIDLSDPENPVLLTAMEFEGSMSINMVKDGHLVMTNNEMSSVMIYSTQNMPTPTFETMVQIVGYEQTIKVYQDAVFVCEGYYGVIGVGV